MKKYILVLFFFISFYSYSNNNYKIVADTAKTDSVKTTAKYRIIKCGIDYASASTFKGRKDTSKLYLFSPYFEFKGKSGFFTKISLVHVPGTKKNFDELATSAGWNFNFSDKWDGSIGYSHYFFDSKAARIRASISNEIDLNVGYDWDLLYSFLDLDWDGGNSKFPTKAKAITKKSNDFFVTFSNSHQFSFDDIIKQDDFFAITPNADILFGTQNFLVTYKGKSDTSNKIYQQQAAKFNLTGYMLYLEMKYRIKKLSFELTPNYTFPKNVPAGESINPYFVMYAGIYYTFKHKK